MDNDKTPKDNEQVAGEVSDSELEKVAGGLTTTLNTVAVCGTATAAVKSQVNPAANGVAR
jgi:hypothetical protein